MNKDKWFPFEDIHHALRMYCRSICRQYSNNKERWFSFGDLTQQTFCNLLLKMKAYESSKEDGKHLAFAKKVAIHQFIDWARRDKSLGSFRERRKVEIECNIRDSFFPGDSPYLFDTNIDSVDLMYSAVSMLIDSGRIKLPESQAKLWEYKAEGCGVEELMLRLALKNKTSLYSKHSKMLANIQAQSSAQEVRDVMEQLAARMYACKV